MYRMPESSQKTKNCLVASKKFIASQQSRRGPHREWDFPHVLIFPERLRNVLLEGRDTMVGKYKAIGPDKEGKYPAAHIVDFSVAFGGIPEGRLSCVLERRWSKDHKHRIGRVGEMLIDVIKDKRWKSQSMF